MPDELWFKILQLPGVPDDYRHFSVDCVWQLAFETDKPGADGGVGVSCAQ